MMSQDDMRILIATGLYPPDIGGPATYAKFLHDELPKHGFDTTVVSFGVVRHMSKLFRHAFYFFKVLRNGKGVDVIFAQDPVSVGLPSAVAAMLLRKKFMLKVVGDYAWEQGRQRFGVSDDLDTFAANRGGYGIMVGMLRGVERWVAHRAQRIIVPSEYLKRIVTGWGVSEDKITVVYNAFRGVAQVGAKDELRKRLDLEGTVLVSAGRLVPWKGFDMLIEVFAELLKDIRDATLFVVGSGPDANVLKEKVRALGLEDRVVLTGALPQAELLEYIRASDIFVLNTGYEGLSHQLLEVMALGTPIVTTDIGGNPELIEHNKDGLLVDYNDSDALTAAIRELNTNSELRQKVSTNAQKKVRSFSVERMLAGTINTIRSL